jgi:hypothetical protein
MFIFSRKCENKHFIFNPDDNRIINHKLFILPKVLLSYKKKTLYCSIIVKFHEIFVFTKIVMQISWNIAKMSWNIATISPLSRKLQNALLLHPLQKPIGMLQRAEIGEQDALCRQVFRETVPFNWNWVYWKMTEAVSASIRVAIFIFNEKPKNKSRKSANNFFYQLWYTHRWARCRYSVHASGQFFFSELKINGSEFPKR